MPSFNRPIHGADGFAPVLLANLVPLVGVVSVGWDAATLSVVYAAEIALSLPLAAVESLFAQRRPPEERNGFVSVTDAELAEKRGSVEVASWLPPIYPRNVPFATGVAMAVVFVPVFLGVALSQVLPLRATLARPEVLASAAGLFLAGVVETAREYFGHREYEEASPYAVIETPVRRGFFLFFLLFAAPALEAAFGGVGVLGHLVLAKAFFEYAAFRSEHGDGDGGRFTDWIAGPDEATTEPDRIEVPDGDPTAVIPTDRRAVLVAGTLQTLTRVAPFYVGFGAFAWLPLAMVLPLEESWVLLVGTALAVLAVYAAVLGVRLGAFYVRFAPLEYRRYDDRVVAYDTWLDEPQWSATAGGLRDVSVVGDRLADRLLGTRTFELTTGWGDEERERCIGPLRDADGVVEAFELPVRTELEPIDRRWVAGAGVAAAFVAALYAAVALGPRESLDSLLLAVILFPFAAMIVFGIWRQAYPDDGDGWPTPDYAE